MATSYQLSGKAPGSAWGLCAQYGVGAAAVIGVAYDLAVVLIPFVYIKVLITGLAAFKGARLSRTKRNPQHF